MPRPLSLGLPFSAATGPARRRAQRQHRWLQRHRRQIQPCGCAPRILPREETDREPWAAKCEGRAMLGRSLPPPSAADAGGFMRRVLRLAPARLRLRPSRGAAQGGSRFATHQFIDTARGTLRRGGSGGRGDGDRGDGGGGGAVFHMGWLVEMMA
eukprot:353893-Chlamydomonas_euryale.AAC.10